MNAGSPPTILPSNLGTRLVCGAAFLRVRQARARVKRNILDGLRLRVKNFGIYTLCNLGEVAVPLDLKKAARVLVEVMQRISE